MCKKRIDGVYAWKCNGRIVYVGSGKDITDSRKSNHLARLRKGTHIAELQELYNKFGEGSFEFIVLEECLVRDLFVREDYYMQLYKDSMLNKNSIKNTTKNKKTGLKAKAYKQKLSKAMQGTNNPNNTKLDVADVLAIKKLLLLKTHTIQEIADIWNVSATLISNIKLGRRWTSVQLTDVELEDIKKEKELLSAN